MLRATFQLLSGIGTLTETSLWADGLRDWSDLVDTLPRRDWSTTRGERLRAELAASERALAERDVDWFSTRLPNPEHWRLYPTFHAETAFLDIETTSLSPYEGMVTVVTVHGGGRTHTFVADDNLEELPACLGRFRILVTFNGSVFDVPFLRVRFPDLIVPAAHIDLRFLLYRLGLAGGLKRIEARLGLGDRTGVEGVTGLDAVRLWAEYRRGQSASLDRLVRYNRADTVNLEPLTDFAVKELGQRLLPPGRRAPAGRTAELAAFSG
ncbi:MAG: ribonuclease H-like domain-containing protein [Thermoplasmata archaeon]|nr:ribonuclease H-like domain-containing protein [Thermoplasmata archaeon]